MNTKATPARHSSKGHPTKQELTEYRDDALDDEREDQVRQPIESCDSCRDLFLELCQ